MAKKHKTKVLENCLGTSLNIFLQWKKNEILTIENSFF